MTGGGPVSGPLLVGLTGGTGSGKSTLSGQWAARGAVVIDADAIAREVVEPGTPGLEQIRRRFGDHLIDPDGRLRRAALAGVVFADPVQLRALEAITHPLIRQRTAQLVEAAPPESVVVHDMPLIVENGTAADHHLVVVVDAPVEDRVRRLAGRGMDAADARRRISAQASTAQRRAVADLWVENAGSVAELAERAERAWLDRIEPFRANLTLGRPAVAPMVRQPDPAWAGDARRLIARLERWSGAHVHRWAAPPLPGPDELHVWAEVPPQGYPGLRRLGFVSGERHRGGQPGLSWENADPGRPAVLHQLVSP